MLTQIYHKKIAIVGTHGVGKTTICEKIAFKVLENAYKNREGILRFIHNLKTNGLNNVNFHITFSDSNFTFIPEQYTKITQEIRKRNDISPKFNIPKQTEKITLSTHAKQSYLENLAQAQGKQAILCDRSVLDTFVYYDYFNNKKIRLSEEGKVLVFLDNLGEYFELSGGFDGARNVAVSYVESYSKIYLIEPSDREIEKDGFRMTDKAQQLEIHKLFLSYFKDFDNVEIINQEDAWKDEFVERVSGELI